ncbi:glycosyltransferase family 2 protein [Flavobacterium pectinovorum]|uniref:glycosyltransferase family 2 protein n=1 Tax=Flavobacterium pectinovorum TaxID=29533 RepID=UPI001FABD73F|nr:glycosyltransferase [Flavobacterium pectinovorum]MCI9843864.1 glycosyltransferase family 2 protein [Flavobacterium pectinovorum]
MEMIRVAVLMTVFNRKLLTIRCLENFEKAAKNTPDINYDIYILDDGSTDGTGNVLKTLFPNVKVIEGDGSYFWCRGMVKVWSEASKFDYDAYILLNNDSYIFDFALEELISSSKEKNHQSIISGAFRSEFYNVSTYGGKLKGQALTLIPDGTLQKIELLNGNLVLVPKVIYDKIGMLDPLFHHSIGDYDYGLRAIKNKFMVVLTKRYVGTCELHDSIQICYDSKKALFSRFKNFYSPLGDNPFQRFYFLNRHYSFFKAISAFFVTHLYVFFPGLLNWYEKLKNNKTV